MIAAPVLFQSGDAGANENGNHLSGDGEVFGIRHRDAEVDLAHRLALLQVAQQERRPAHGLRRRQAAIA
jgi:hypothetical protein